MAKLIISDGKSGETVHEITDDVTTFGRSSINIIQVKDEQSSRQHCRIEKAGDGYRLVDLGSRNGTDVNGVKVSGQTLKPGDTITIGEYKIVFDEKLEVTADELGATVEVDPSAVEQALVPAQGAKDPLADQQAPQFILEVTEGSGTGTKIELGVDPVTMGRNASNKLIVNDEAASNYHAEVSKEAIGYVVSDLGSTNGTKVNGEKIVKSPLAHGARIQIGSTVIVFKNLGAPTEEDAAFGTVVLDSDKLEQELAAAKRGGGGAGRVLAALVIIALVGLGGYGIAQLFKGGNGPVNGGPTLSEVANSSFSEDTDNQGNPREWVVRSTHPRNRVIVDTAKGRESGKEGDAKFSAKFQRDEAAKVNARIECRQAGTFEVDRSSGYRASVYMICPSAEGLYGLRLTWVGSGKSPRESEEYATISGPHPKWKQVKLESRPPKWAAKLRLALVAFGNIGNVWFDDAALEKMPFEDAPIAGESVDFGGVRARLDRSGRLSLERGGITALSGLIVAEGQDSVATDQSLARIDRGFPRSEGGNKLFQGSIYDFSRGRPFNYKMTARKGDNGVHLDYAFGTHAQELTLDSISLKFTIESAFASAPTIYTSSGKRSFTKGQASGVSELVLRGPGKELALSFTQPAELTMVARGEKKELIVLLAKSPSLGAVSKSFSLDFTASSASAAAKKAADFSAVTGLFDDKKWASFPAAVAKFRRDHPTATSELSKLSIMEQQHKKLKEDAKQQADQAVKLAKGASPEGYDRAYKLGKKTLDDLKDQWADTDLASHINTAMVRLDETLKTRTGMERAREAEGWLKKAEDPMNKELWLFARVFLLKVIKEYPETNAAKRAKKLLKICDSNITREEMIIKEEERLLKDNLFRNHKLNGQYQKAIDRITRDPAYRKYGKQMKDVQKELAELHAKLKE